MEDENGLSVLGGLAQEAQYWAKSVANGMIQLGRVLTEAKPMVKHGEWEQWILDNAGCSVRYAQAFMQAYARFGNNEAIARIGERGKIFKLLSLPEGTEDKFLEEHDVESMTAREVAEAVRKVRAEKDEEMREMRRKLTEDKAEALRDQYNKMGQEINAANMALERAQARAKRLEEGREIPEHVNEELAARQAKIKEQKAELERVTEIGRGAIEDANKLRAENAKLKAEIAEQGEQMEDAQRQYDSLRGELLSLRSEAARGDAERNPANELTVDVFAGAVRQFIGTCARMPHMGRAFGTMEYAQRCEYEELLQTMEGWVQGARKAMNVALYEGGEDHG